MYPSTLPSNHTIDVYLLSMYWCGLKVREYVCTYNTSVTITILYAYMSCDEQMDMSKHLSSPTSVGLLAGVTLFVRAKPLTRE